MKKIKYKEHLFDFETDSDDSLIGRIALSQKNRELLTRLLDEESEIEWYLDDNGERLPEDRLFALSPWSLIEASSSVKLLCRSMNIIDGSAHFQKQETYLGEVSDYVRQKNQTPTIPLDAVEMFDLVELLVNLENVDDGCGRGKIVNLCRGETGTVVMDYQETFTVEFLEKDGSGNTKALIDLPREQVKLHSKCPK